VQSFTSFELSLEHSKQFFLIAFNGVKCFFISTPLILFIRILFTPFWCIVIQEIFTQLKSLDSPSRPSESRLNHSMSLYDSS
jgi:hypothetical protein